MKPPHQLLLKIESPTVGQEGKLAGLAPEGEDLGVSQLIWEGLCVIPRGRFLNNEEFVGSRSVDTLFYLYLPLNFPLAVKKCVVDLDIYCLMPAC